MWLSLSGALIAALVTLVYFLVPRGVMLGTPVFEPQGFKRDAVSGDYALHLQIHVPIYNRNYFPVRGRSVFQFRYDGVCMYFTQRAQSIARAYAQCNTFVIACRLLSSRLRTCHSLNGSNCRRREYLASSRYCFWT